MSEWMWFTVVLVGMFLTYAGFIKWNEASVKINQILREELHNNESESNSEDR